MILMNLILICAKNQLKNNQLQHFLKKQIDHMKQHKHA